jgi:hypothetical protein
MLIRRAAGQGCSPARPSSTFAHPNVPDPDRDRDDEQDDDHDDD